MLLKFSIQALVIALTINYANCQVSYDGYTVLRCRPQDEEQVQRLTELMSIEVSDGVKFWTEPNALNSSVDIMVSPTEQKSILKKLNDWHIPMQKVLSDVGATIRRANGPIIHSNRLGNSTLRAGVESSFYSYYQPYSTFEAKLKQLETNPLVSMQTIGKSFEGRPIYVVKISKDPAAGKPVIVIDGLHHAREWISGSTAMYLIDSLTEQGRRDMGGQFEQRINKRLQTRGRVTGKQFAAPMTDSSILNIFDVWVVPVVNPDGYEYTRLSDRLWRKTRSSNGYCIGTDPNRNYPHHWREVGASSFSCSETYAGPKAGSEVEVQHMMRLMRENRNRISMYISLHAYSQVILSPYGYARKYPENYEELERVAQAGMGGISSVRGTSYRFGTSAILLYPAAGGSDDWAFGELGVKYSYTIELPDQGRFGFLLPPSEIRPVGQEIFAGITAMARATQDKVL